MGAPKSSTKRTTSSPEALSSEPKDIPNEEIDEAKANVLPNVKREQKSSLWSKELFMMLQMFVCYFWLQNYTFISNPNNEKDIF
jgi:hypothetical protein